MTIGFPNHSRSYDATRDAVRFWGHDRSMEVSFFITSGALARLQPEGGHDEQSLLTAFDRHRDAICRAATRLYGRGKGGNYDLTPADF